MKLNSANGVIVHDGCILLTNRCKANAFVGMYEKVSIKILRERDLKKCLNIRLRMSGAENADCMRVNLSEVCAVLREMNGNKAGRPDYLHPRILKNLSDSIVEVVWGLFRCVFENK